MKMFVAMAVLGVAFTAGQASAQELQFDAYGRPISTRAPVVQDGYGAGVNRDTYGQPQVYRDATGAVLDPVQQQGVQRDRFAPGLSMDQYGRPVTDSKP